MLNKDLGRIGLAADRAGGLRPEPRAASQPKALVTLRGALSKLPGLIFDDGSDPINRACTRIAIVALVAVWAIYLETLR